MRYNRTSGPRSSASSLSPWLRQSPESAPVSDTRKLSPGDENREGESLLLSDVICGESREINMTPATAAAAAAASRVPGQVRGPS